MVIMRPDYRGIEVKLKSCPKKACYQCSKEINSRNNYYCVTREERGGHCPASAFLKIADLKKILEK